MNEYLTQALERLDKEFKDGKALNRYAGVMAGPVKKQLEDFCRQDGEFAQAVVQGGTFKDCMAAVTKEVGQSLSDLEAYSRAVRFYFPGAKVHFRMELDLVGDAAAEDSKAEAEPRAERKVLNLADFF